MKFKRVQPNDPKSPSSRVAAADLALEKSHGAFVEWMTVTAWEDGKKRQTGTLLIMCEDGLWKAWMNDRDAGRACWVSGATFTQLMIQVDNVLAEGTGEWRAPKPKR